MGLGLLQNKPPEMGNKIRQMNLETTPGLGNSNLMPFATLRVQVQQEQTQMASILEFCSPGVEANTTQNTIVLNFVLPVLGGVAPVGCAAAAPSCSWLHRVAPGCSRLPLAAPVLGVPREFCSPGGGLQI